MKNLVRLIDLLRQDLPVRQLDIGNAEREIKNLRQRFLEELPAEGFHSGSEYQKGWNAAARMAADVLDRLLPGDSK